MEQEIKIIEIPNFITIKFVKINNKYCAYYVLYYNNEYFCANENGYLKTQPKVISFWALSITMPMIEDNVNIKPLEEDIYKLHKILTKGKLIRAEKGQKYYVIASDFRVAINIETNTTYDNDLYKLHNYFLSKSQAEQFAGKLQEHLIELWKEGLKNNCTKKSYN